MGGHNIQTFRFAPRSVTDAQDGGLVAEGALAAASDLIFDPANPFMLQCRPAATKDSVFAGIADAGVVSIARVVGDICYGLIASSAVAAHDVPFAYNLTSHALVTVTGTQTSATLPATPTTTGKWSPPTMALVGPLLYVTHPGFSGGAKAFFGWFDTADPVVPVWHGGNTTGNALPYVPAAVGSFNNRAWFASKNNLTFTDALTTNVTALGAQTLTIGDAEIVTALASLPVMTSVQGIIQSLAVFKTNAVALITGDAITGDLAINVISPESVGCLAGRTVAAGPKGLRFMATDGIRTINQNGTLDDPNPDLKIPFMQAITPSRASAGYSNGIYRISVQNGAVEGTPIQEYWFDEGRNGWTGPHSFVQNMCCAFEGVFVAFSNARAPGLWLAPVSQDGNSLFTEDGTAMSWFEFTAPLAENSGLYENSAVLSVIDMQLPKNGDVFTFAASDVSHGALSAAQIVSPPVGTVWGSFTWGADPWTPISYGLDRYNIPWTQPLVFSRMLFQAAGPSSAALKIGKLLLGYQPLKYIRSAT